MKYLRKFETEADVMMMVQPNVVLVADTESVMFNVPEPHLTIIAIEDLTISFPQNPIEYSFDGKSWQTLQAGTSTPTVSLGSKIRFKASGITPTDSDGIGTFSISGKCNIAGNIMSMLYADDFQNHTSVNSNALRKLFSGQPVVDASNLLLPASTLGNNCYRSMFEGCNQLIKAPELPATTIAYGCYFNMFKDCASLKYAPSILPANNLFENCYNSMFMECVSLISTPILPALSLAKSCYSNLFYNCEKISYIKAMFLLYDGQSLTSWVRNTPSAGTFVKNAAATWENIFGAAAIPTGWTVELAES